MFNGSILPSRLLSILLACWAGLAMIAVWLSALPWWFCVLIDAVVGAWLTFTLQHYWGFGTQQLFFRDNQWTITRHGQSHAVLLEGEFYLSRYLIVLVFRNEFNKKLTLIVLPDAMATEDRRRLRVLLKHMPGLETAS